MGATWTQRLDNLPPELLEYDAFIPVANNKIPTINDWTNPETWKAADEIKDRKGLVMSDIPFFFLDFDHLRKQPNRKAGLNAEGMDIRSVALFRKVLEVIREATHGEETYCEYSCSGCGLHMVLRPDEFEFQNLSLIGGDNGTIHLLPEADYEAEEKAKRNPPKLELYYHSAHQIILTGDRVNAAGILSGEAANATVHALLEMLKNSNHPKTTPDEVVAPQVLTGAERERLLSALHAIDPDCHYEDWIKLGNACRNSGLTLEDWEAWSRGDYWPEKAKKYTPDKRRYSCKDKWKTFTGRSRWNQGTIIIQARKYGWKSNSFKAVASEELKQRSSLLPEDRTDLEQATIFSHHYRDRICYCPETGFLVFDGISWRASDERARGLVHEFVERQTKEAADLLRECMEREFRFADSLGGQPVEEGSSEAAEQKRLAKDVKAARSMWAWTLKQQQTGKITAVIRELPPKILIDHTQLDHDPYQLNTPAGTVNLKTGELLQHDPGNLITKCCSAGPSSEGSDEWERFLDQITGGKADMKDYLQIVSGMAAIGEVKQEKALFFYGTGGNGKSAFTNAVSAVLGDYSGRISPDVMTNSNNKTGPEFAELRGKRFVIASELSEGARLNTRIIKLLATADEIVGEPKFRQQFRFRPSHTLVINTNHLPRMESNDKGSLDRVIVVPFTQRFRGTGEEIMDYGHVLAERCGGAILQWIVDGARKFIESGYRLPEPEDVRKAVEEYRADNDWISDFIEAKCETDLTYNVPSGDLYKVYSWYCQETGAYKRSAADFKAALLGAGYDWRKTTGGKRLFFGLRIKENFIPATASPFEE